MCERGFRMFSVVSSWAYSGFQLRRGRETSGRRPRGARPEEPRAGVGFLGRGRQPPPHRLGPDLGERCKFPQPSSFTTFEVLRKASADTSVFLLLLKIGSHMNAVVRCQKLLTFDPSCYLIQFSIVQTSAPFPVDFARVTCVI